MNSKIIVSLALIFGSCSDALYAQPSEQSAQIKKTKTQYAKFRAVLKCARNWKGCTPQERKKAVLYGVETVAAIIGLVGVGSYLVWRGKRSALQRSFPKLPKTSKPSALKKTRGSGQKKKYVRFELPEEPEISALELAFKQLNVFEANLKKMQKSITDLNIRDADLNNNIHDIESGISKARQMLRKKQSIDQVVKDIEQKFDAAHKVINEAGSKKDAPFIWQEDE